MSASHDLILQHHYNMIEKARKAAHKNNAHPTSQIGVVLELLDGRFFEGSNLTLQSFAAKPHDILNIKIGSASPTKHAETAIICKAAQQGGSVKGSTLYLTTVPCPNCMNFIAASGLQRVIIDSCLTDWEKRRGHHYHATSLQIASNAGVQVSRISYDDKQNMTLVDEALPAPTKLLDFNQHYKIKWVKADQFNLDAYEQSFQFRAQFKGLSHVHENRYRNALTSMIIPPNSMKHKDKSKLDSYCLISAHAVKIIDYDDKKQNLLKQKSVKNLKKSAQKAEIDKYFTAILSLDMLRAAIAREGLVIHKGTKIYSSGIPSSHEIVSLCDITSSIELIIAKHNLAWKPCDKEALEAYKKIGCDLEIPPHERICQTVL